MLTDSINNEAGRYFALGIKSMICVPRKGILAL
jgi:hypothetical protein